METKQQRLIDQKANAQFAIVQAQAKANEFGIPVTVFVDSVSGLGFSAALMFDQPYRKRTAIVTWLPENFFI